MITILFVRLFVVMSNGGVKVNESIVTFFDDDGYLVDG